MDKFQTGSIRGGTVKNNGLDYLVVIGGFRGEDGGALPILKKNGNGLLKLYARDHGNSTTNELYGILDFNKKSQVGYTTDKDNSGRQRPYIAVPFTSMLKGTGVGEGDGPRDRILAYIYNGADPNETVKVVIASKSTSLGNNGKNNGTSAEKTHNNPLYIKNSDNVNSLFENSTGGGASGFIYYMSSYGGPQVPNALKIRNKLPVTKITPSEEVSDYINNLNSNDLNKDTLEYLVDRYKNDKDALRVIEKKFGVSII